MIECKKCQYRIDDKWSKKDWIINFRCKLCNYRTLGHYFYYDNIITPNWCPIKEKMKLRKEKLKNILK